MLHFVTHRKHIFFSYTDQSVCAVWGHNPSLVGESHRTYKFNLWAECGVSLMAKETVYNKVNIVL